MQNVKLLLSFCNFNKLIFLNAVTQVMSFFIIVH